MRNLKKILALVLALMMVLSVMVTASAASPLEKYEDYASINPAYEKAVEVMTVAGVFSGNGNDFEPTRVLTRQEAATLITILATGGEIDAYKAKAETQFDDVPATHWASGFINYCASNELILGTGNNKYSPALELSYEQYAAMLLRVLKVDCTTDGKWYVPVRNNAISNGLMEGIETYVWTAGLTREAACQMTFNAMLANGTKTLAGYMVGENSNLVFPTYLEAYLIAKDESAEVNPYYVTTGDLMSKFLVSYGEGFDLYGRPSDNYTYKDAEGETHTLYYPDAADFVYTSATKASTIKADLKGYILPVNSSTTIEVESTLTKEFSNSATGIVTIDAETKINLKTAAGLTEAVTPSAALAKLTGKNAVVEIFADEDKNIEAIVVTNTYIGKITAVIEEDEDAGTPEMIEVDSAYYAVNTGFAEGDKVTYTVRDTYAENVAEAEYIIGTLTAYTSTDTYTVNGTVYTLDRLATAKAATIKGMYGAEYAYYLGANNTIIDATHVPGTDPAVLTEYAMVIDYDTKVKVTTETWMSDTSTTITSVVAQVSVVTADGTAAIYDLDVVKASAAISGTDVGKGDYYVKVAGDYVILVDVDGGSLTNTTAATAAAKTALENALSKTAIYTYEAEDGVITLADTLDALSGTETESGAYWRGNSKGITSTSTTVSNSLGVDIIVNDETVFILKDTDSSGNASIVVKKGAPALQYTRIPTWTKVVVDVTVTEEGNINVAKVVFAQNVEFEATYVDADVVEDVVLIDGDFTTTYDASGDPVYTYTVITAAGEVITLVGDGTHTMGLYTYNEDGEIEAKVDTGLVATGVISGTTAKLGSDYLVVNEDTVITDLTGEGFETGCYVMYVLAVDSNGDATNVVSNIFVLVAAE